MCFKSRDLLLGGVWTIEEWGLLALRHRAHHPRPQSGLALVVLKAADRNGTPR